MSGTASGGLAEGILWRPMLLLGAAGIVPALVSRWWLGYPRCPSDERNWLAILERLDQGVDWPVSGPGFVWGVRRLARATGLDYGEMLPLLAVFGAAAIPLALLHLYRRAGLSPEGAAGSAALLLASSYFLGPLLEARPQQWGMVLVLLVLLGYRRMERRPVPPVVGLFLLGYGGLFLYHILSFMILNGLLGIHVALNWICGRRPGRPELWWLAGAAGALAVLLSDGGPYRVMLQDLRQYHFRHLSWPLPVAGLSVLVAALVSLRRRRFRIRFPRPQWGLRGFLLVGAGVLLFAGTLQAWFAPPQYLAAYQGSPWRFLLVQSGNLVFGLCFVWGAWQVVERGGDWPFFFRAALYAMALGALVLLLSPWLGDKNGMIRIMNYWMLPAAPVAWAGLGRMPPALRRVVVLGWPLWLGASLLHVTRPPWMLGC